MRRWLKLVLRVTLVGCVLAGMMVVGALRERSQYSEEVQEHEYEMQRMYLRACVTAVDGLVAHIAYDVHAEDVKHLVMLLPLCDAMLEGLAMEGPLTPERDFSLGQTRLFLDAFLEKAREAALKEVELETIYARNKGNLDDEAIMAEIFLREKEQKERVEELVELRMRIFEELARAD